MKQFLVAVCFALALSTSAFGETNVVPEPAAVAQQETKSDFKSNLIEAIKEARKEGKITVREALTLRIASMSPAFVSNAEQLCVVQMVFSGENPEAIPMASDGTVNKTAINWAELGKFLQVVLPLLLELLKGLGVGA